MPFTTASQLCREAPIARLDDPLGLVAENLRESHYGCLPVIDGEMLPNGRPAPGTRVVGVIYERDISEPVLNAVSALPPRPQAANPFSGAPLETLPSDATPPGLRDLRACDLIRGEAGYIPALFSLPNVLFTLDRYECDALPVISENGEYRGMISRADAVAAMGGWVRPPSVGGMATPLGVWLTTGNVSGGAPPLGLFLSGVCMGGMAVLSQVLLYFALAKLNPDWGAMFLSGRLGADSDSSGLFNMLVTAVQGALFIGFMRLTPLAGYHAAEHQTVWAIERGVPLTPEAVAKMPRPHPRCGTNLVVLLGLTHIVLRHLPGNSSGNALIGLVFVFFFWRNFGEAVQQYGTTRPASLKQLESGIRAGNEVLRKYQDAPHVELAFGRRLWNSGLLYSAAGMILVINASSLLLTWAANTVLR